MLSKSLSITRLAALSRPVCGIIDKTMVLTLPGSPKGATENLDAVLDILPHALELLQNKPNAGEVFHQNRLNQHHDCILHRHRKSPFPMISYENALETVLSHSHLLEPVSKLLSVDLVGLTFAEDICSSIQVPSCDTSMLDGYAVIASVGPGEYPVIDVSTAGNAVDSLTHLTSGQITRIATGAPIPKGANAIVMIESTTISSSKDGEESMVRIHDKVKEGFGIRRQGSDIQKGQILVKKASVCSASDIGLLASVGIQSLQMYPRPIVAVLSSGNEVVDHFEELKPGKIYDANRPSLLSALTNLHYPTIDLGIASDNKGSLLDKINQGLEEADVLITTGGVSMV